MRTRFACLALVAALAAPSIAAAAELTGFQLQFSGLFASPAGTLPSLAGANESTIFGGAAAFDVTASMGFRRRWFGAVRAGWCPYANRTTTSVFTGFPAPAGATLAPGSGPYELEHDLHTVPVFGLIQYRRVTSNHPGWYVEAGGGVISSTEKLRLRNASGELLEITGYQHDPAWTAGLGLEFPFRSNTAIVVGGRWDGTITDDGAIWKSGDNPRYVSAALGIRYPRVTH